MFKKILVPLDGSTLAEKVLSHVKPLARGFGSEVILFHVLRIPAISASPNATIIEDEELAEQDAQRYLERVENHLEEEGISARPVIVKGKAAESIVDYAELERVDLIAMSTHGRSGLGRWVFGSVAERVLQGAHCPILLIHAREE